jgi:hypothetical protein
MSKVKSVTTAAITLSLLIGASFSSSAMDKQVEESLISVCKAAKSDSLLNYRKTAKSFHLADKTIASKVMCNGSDIIDFAQQHGSYKIASRLENSLLSGNVNITDIAAISKINVTFSE